MFYEQGHELVCTQLPAGYNEPARIEVKCGWDVFADASFIYWQPQQENMELGISNTVPFPSLSTHGIQGKVIDMNFEYKPGFKVGLGMNFGYDSWDAHTEYTWLHGRDTVSSSGPGTVGGNVLSLQGSAYHGGNAFNTGEGTWRFKFDFLDAEMARSYYVGKKLSFRPYFGLRGAWIRQKYKTHYVNNGTTVEGTDQDWTVRNQSVSWGIGPRAGIGTNWMLGRGFRVYGDAIADILYTRYNLNERETDPASSAWAQNVSQHHIDYLRTHVDLELGIGWGSYFNNNKWHVDLSASYGFQTFFSQNMFRHYDNGVVGYSTVPNGNLYIQGLTAQLRTDF